MKGEARRKQNTCSFCESVLYFYNTLLNEGKRISMTINVKSEIGPLKRVMLHRPGSELEHLVPGELERLLFDDIPYLKIAREEHDRFAQILRENGTEVVYLEDLVAQVFGQEPELRTRFIRQLILEAGSQAGGYEKLLFDYLSAIPDDLELVKKTMSGVTVQELQTDIRKPLVRLIRPRGRFLLDPIPNLYFTRDPFATIGRGVSLHHMFSGTRRRETIYGEYILKYHPGYAPGLPFYYRREDPFAIEGGDILNLSPEVLAVGLSQRTSPEAVEMLAERIFADEESSIRTILALDIPNIRAFMHLDTVCTQIDFDKFVVHPGILETLKIYEITPAGAGELAVRESNGTLDQVFAKCLGLDRVTLIRCGGNDRIVSEREQWNDGSNTLCVAPGKVVVYDRNAITNEILRDHGITVLEMPGSELSRGRGGPRCMSMPLIREDLQQDR